MTEPRIPPLHAVTASDVLSQSDFHRAALSVMRVLGTSGAIHLRGGTITAALLFDLTGRLAAEQESTGCRIVVNDRVDIAAAAGAWGVQLTSRSLPLPDARRVAPGAMIGASVHSVREALTAERSGADWLVAGHVYETGSHPGEPGRGSAFLGEISAAVAIPVIAIGGIRPAHVPELRGSGVHGVAAITGFWGAPDAGAAAREYLSMYDAGDGEDGD